MTNKKYSLLIILLIIFILTTLGLSIFLMVPKYENITYIKDNFTGSIQNDDIRIKTFILKIFSDDGEIVDLMDYELSSYGQPGLIIVSGNSKQFRTTNNMIRLYYKYDVQVISTNTYLNDDGFAELEYEFLDNGLVYFKSLINNTVNETNQANFYFNMPNNIGVRLSFERKSERVRI